MEDVFAQMIEMQEKKLLELGRSIVSHLTSDDVLQPNDFPELEFNPHFRFEEGILKGIQSARAAYLAEKKLRCSSF